ncbi:hypothetical protein [Streptomyces sp. NPDC020917]|uniref:hypothetical protein n=1 Tax=Streptomyces sp. NPDC020917 TaxID=3365102 RepID=UPI0037BCDAB4
MTAGQAGIRRFTQRTGVALVAVGALAACGGGGGGGGSTPSAAAASDAAPSGATPTGSASTGTAPATAPVTRGAPSGPADSSVVLTRADQAKAVLPPKNALPGGWSTNGSDALRGDPVRSDDDCSFEPCTGAKFTGYGDYHGAGDAPAHDNVQAYDTKAHAQSAFTQAAAGGDGYVKTSGPKIGNESQYFTRTADGGTDQVILFRVGTVVAEVSLAQGSANPEDLQKLAATQAERTAQVLAGQTLTWQRHR